MAQHRLGRARPRDAKGDPAEASGKIRMDDTAVLEGAHAFAIVGYDAEGFWVMNSWGRGWGAEGFGHWSYEDWRKHVLDAWVLRLARRAKAPQTRPRRTRLPELDVRGKRPDRLAGKRPGAARQGRPPLGIATTRTSSPVGERRARVVAALGAVGAKGSRALDLQPIANKEEESPVVAPEAEVPAISLYLALDALDREVAGGRGRDIDPLRPSQ